MCPTYEYKREDGTVFDYVQSMSAEKLTHCPDTGQEVTRIISGGKHAYMQGGGTTGKALEAYKKNPHLTTLDHYQKKIDANTQKAREMKAKALGQ